jgi:hypothetical protein
MTVPGVCGGFSAIEERFRFSTAGREGIYIDF